MRLTRALAPNDWNAREFLTVAMMLQVSLWALLGLDEMGLDLPPLRVGVAFVFLTTIPGFAILRILRLRGLGPIESLLYAVGLSIAVEMFVGLLGNLVLPAVGIRNPISTLWLTACYSVTSTALSFFAYTRDQDHMDRKEDGGERLPVRVVAMVSLIPIGAVIGAYFENYYNSPVILATVILSLAALVLLGAATNLVPGRLHGYVVFAISLALLYHRSLISPYLWGWDVFHEFYLANYVVAASYWNPALAFNTNAMLSTVVLAPAYSLISGISLDWTFKAVWPVFFSMLPVALYASLKDRMPPRLAFLSVCFFVAVYVFYGELPQVPRQEIAELFIGLTALALTSKARLGTARNVLLIIFAVSVVVSHYGASYIFMGCLVLALVILLVRRTRAGFARGSQITPTFVIMVLVFGLSWYLYVSSSSNLTSVVQIGSHIINSLATDLLSPRSSQPVEIALAGSPSLLHDISGGLQLLSQGLIALGILAYARRRSRVVLDPSFAALGGASFLVLIASVVLPYFASALNTSRMYQLALVFLAPFLPIGGLALAEIARALPWSFHRELRVKRDRLVPLLAVFLAIFLLFNTGLVYALAHDNPNSISLDSTIDFPRYSRQEFTGAQWIASRDGDHPIYADGNRFQLFLAYGVAAQYMPRNPGLIPTQAFIFVGNYNLAYGQVLILTRVGANVESQYVTLNSEVSIRSSIYDNGGCQVFL